MTRKVDPILFHISCKYIRGGHSRAIRCNKLLHSENNNTRSLKINIYQRTILVRVSYLPLLPNRFHQALH